MSARPKPVILAILDGWGHTAEVEHNAIAAARTPNFHRLLRDYPSGLINASELHVGLPHGQMGNSEVGHMNIGSGRVVMQDLPRIDQAIEDGSLAQLPALQQFIAHLKSVGKRCHLLGLISPGGVHAHQRHIAALARIVAGAGVPVCIHAFLDGRDTPPQSAIEYIGWLEQEIQGVHAHIVTVTGRYFAMDRDKRWERIERAYQAIVSGQGARHPTALSAIQAGYKANQTDEFMPPSVIGEYGGFEQDGGLLMANFRADRAREILSSLLDPHFSGFARARTPKISAALGLTEYSEDLNRFMGALFAPQPLTKILGEVVAEAGLKQLRIAETEKYAHVTFFFNGGREAEFPGEERILVPSPKVATYDLKPEMSAYEITDRLVAAIEKDQFDLIVVNYANTDMVGHTGNLEAAAKAVEAVDHCLGSLLAAVEKKGGAMLVTADHGNAEMMFDHGTEQAHTAHTINLVPAIVVAPGLKGQRVDLPEGRLADVAPTILQLLRLPQPAEMTGRSLLPDAA